MILICLTAKYTILYNNQNKKLVVQFSNRIIVLFVKHVEFSWFYVRDSIVRQDEHLGSEGQGFEFSAARQLKKTVCFKRNMRFFCKSLNVIWILFT